ncbi:MAG: hypothetical protein J2P45_10225 [Candidatus Dormibacteraeota bacterium]|nr:hypothetical protein [Candidatus Dormibacteraeota bacterium]
MRLLLASALDWLNTPTSGINSWLDQREAGIQAWIPQHQEAIKNWVPDHPLEAVLVAAVLILALRFLPGPRKG